MATSVEELVAAVRRVGTHISNVRIVHAMDAARRAYKLAEDAPLSPSHVVMCVLHSLHIKAQIVTAKRNVPPAEVDLLPRIEHVPPYFTRNFEAAWDVAADAASKLEKRALTGALGSHGCTDHEKLFYAALERDGTPELDDGSWPLFEEFTGAMVLAAVGEAVLDLLSLAPEAYTRDARTAAMLRFLRCALVMTYRAVSRVRGFSRVLPFALLVEHHYSPGGLFARLRARWPVDVRNLDAGWWQLQQSLRAIDVAEPGHLHLCRERFAAERHAALLHQLRVFAAPRLVCANCRCLFIDLKLCGRCRRAGYCSKTCQTAHWPAHKPACAGAADGA